MVQGQVWEVICPSGILVRQGRSLASPPLDQPLSPGSLVQEQEQIGDRLRYNRIAGTGCGPDSGWVSLRTKTGELLVPADWAPPKQGWTVLSKELPSDDEIKALPPIPQSANRAPKAGPGSVAPPQKAQTSGDPYVFDRQITFIDTKPTGLRMSACFSAMEDARTDLFSICDQNMQSMGKVTDPFVQVALELRPEIRKLNPDKSDDGLLHAHPDSKGAVLSWLRVETQFGWPYFPLRNEEVNLILLGKNKHNKQGAPIARARFQECFLDENDEVLQADMEKDVAHFFAKVKSDHSIQALDCPHLKSLYPAGAGPFAPTKFQKVTWRMSAYYGDLWNVLFHAKTPELLWDLNMLAEGPFAELVKKEQDPQAIAFDLPKKMEVGVRYDALCFLDEVAQKGVYVLLPADAINNDGYNKECVLVVCANYNWKAAPADGRTLRTQDFDVLGAPSRTALMDFAAGKEPKAVKCLELSGVQAA